MIKSPSEQSSHKAVTGFCKNHGWKNLGKEMKYGLFLLFSLVFDMKKIEKANSQEVLKYEILEERWWKKRQNIIPALPDIHFLDTVLALGSFQHCVGKDSLNYGIYSLTTLKKLMRDLVIYFQTSVQSDSIKIPERLIWQLWLYLTCTLLCNYCLL